MTSKQNSNSAILAKYLTESMGCNSIPLMETTLNRVQTKHAADGYFIVSASRNTFSDQENKRRTDDLEADLRAYGKYSYLPVTGGFIETRHPDPEHPETEVKVEVTERAFLVMSRRPLDTPAARAQYMMNMLDDARALCAKYAQDSVLIQLPGHHPMYLTASGAVDGVFDGTPKFNDLVKIYFTKLHRGGDSKPSDLGSHGRFSLRTKEEQLDDESKLGLATNGPSGTINGNHARMIHGDLSEEVFREGL